MKKTPSFFQDKKRNGRKIAVLTCYDYPTAAACQAVGIEMLLVGDSVGTNILGYESERDVTLDDIAHHVRATRRGATDPFVLADLPFGTYDTPAKALANARLLREAGADGVKLEGAKPEIIRHLVDNGIDVSAHLGLEPQHHADKAVRGGNAAEARQLLADARLVTEAGAFMMVLELIPEELGGMISQRIAIPTIGIGAGRQTDGQVLVITDVLGITPRNFHHNRRYQDFGPLMQDAMRRYKTDVESGDFPAAANVFPMAPAELRAVTEN